MEKNKTLERISGAIGLIFIGTVLLMINFGYFSFGDLLAFLFSVWPLFIVVWGIKIIMGIFPYGKWINLVIDVLVDVAIVLVLVLGYGPRSEWRLPSLFINGNLTEVSEIKDEFNLRIEDFSNVKEVKYNFEIGAAEFSIKDTDQSDYLVTKGKYSKNVFEPQLESVESNGTMRVTFEQRLAKRMLIHPWSVESEFNFETPSALPKTYDIKLGAGKGTLDVNSNTVDTMKIDIGAGEMTININEALKGSMDINVGAGRAVIYIPAGAGYTLDYNVGVGELSVFRNKEKKSMGGLGNKGNASFNADSENVLVIKVNVGAGSVEIEEK